MATKKTGGTAPPPHTSTPTAPPKQPAYPAKMPSGGVKKGRKD